MAGKNKSDLLPGSHRWTSVTREPSPMQTTHIKGLGVPCPEDILTVEVICENMRAYGNARHSRSCLHRHPGFRMRLTWRFDRTRLWILGGSMKATTISQGLLF